MSDDTPMALPPDPSDWRSPGGHVLSRDAVLAHVPDERTDPPTYRAVTVGDVVAMQEQAERVEAELREWEKHHCEKRITTPCPSCGHQSLFIAVGGHLTCSWLKCPEPGPAAAFKAERQQREQAEAERDALRAVLVDVRAVVAELVAVDRRRLSRVVADIDAALAQTGKAGAA